MLFIFSQYDIIYISDLSKLGLITKVNHNCAQTVRAVASRPPCSLGELTSRVLWINPSVNALSGDEDQIAVITEKAKGKGQFFVGS